MIIAKEKGQGKGTESTGRGGSEILDRVARKSATRRHREKGWRKWRNQLSRYLGKEHSMYRNIKYRGLGHIYLYICTLNSSSAKQLMTNSTSNVEAKLTVFYNLESNS